MKKLGFIIFLWTVVLFNFNSLNAQLTVSPYNNGSGNNGSGQNLEQYIQNHLVGSGITISNVTFTGANRQFGSFNATNTKLNTDENMDQGLLITTGLATNAIGPNTVPWAAGPNAYIGNMTDDPDLHMIGGTSYEDVAILEFDFIPDGNTIEFDYIFGSEEYPEFVYDYNDAFGFFLSGPGISGPFSNNAINLAVIPNTNIPITIDNVHDRYPFGGGFVSECMNCNYFVYNGDPNGANTVPPYSNQNQYIQYDGYTVRLTASAEVECGETYHIKIAIGDARDQAYDSGVFLKGGSFISDAKPVDVVVSNGEVESDEVTIYRDCSNTNVIFYRGGDLSQPLTITYTISGDAQNGQDYNGNLTGTVTFPANVDNVTIPIDAINNGNGSSTLVLTIESTVETPCGGSETTYSEVTIYIEDKPDATFTIEDFCEEGTGGVSIIGDDGGTFSFNPSVTDGATIDPVTGVISNGVGGTTYTVEYTIELGDCVVSTTETVNVFEKPTPIITGDNEYCAGGSTILDAGSGYASYDWSTNENTQTIEVDQSQSPITVTVEDENGCVGTSAPYEITELPPITTTTEMELCSGESVVIHGNWESVSGTYTHTYTTAEGCDSISVVNLIVNPKIIPAFNNLTTSICQGDNIPAFPNTSTNGIPGTWSPQLDNQSTTVYTFLPNQGFCAEQITHTITVEEKITPIFTQVAPICEGETLAPLPSNSGNNVSGTWSPAVNNQETTDYVFTPAQGECATEANMTIVVNPNPDYSVEIINPSCGVDDGEITINATDGTAPYEYFFNGTSYESSNNFDNLSAGSYSIEIVDANNCSISGTVSLNNEDGPEITLVNLDNPSCFGEDDGTIEVSVDGGTGDLTITWEDGNQEIAQDQETVNGLESGVYTITVTDENGCIAVETYTIVDPTQVDASFTLTDFCEGAANHATISGLTGGTFTFNPPVNDGATINPNTGEITNGVAGTTYTVEYVVTDANSCTNSSIETVTVNVLPEPEIDGDSEYCAGNSVTLDAGNGYDSYTWSNGANTQTTEVTQGDSPITVTVTNGFGCEGTSDPFYIIENPAVSTTTNLEICQGESILIHGNLESTSGTYTDVFQSITGCDSTSVVNLIVNPLPNVVINGANEYCPGSSVILDAGNGYASYDWSTGENTQTIEVTEDDNPITVTVIDQNGCEATSEEFFVEEKEEITITTQLQICEGETILIHGNVESEEGTFIDTFPSYGGCDSTSVVILTVNPLPETEIFGDDEYCQGSSITLDAGAGFSNYDWSTGGNGQTEEVTEANNPITVTVTDENGCENTSEPFYVTEIPTTNTSEEFQICQGESILIHGVEQSTTGVYTEIYTGQNGCDSTSVITLIVNPLPEPQILGESNYCFGGSASLSVGGEYVSYEWSNGTTEAEIEVTEEDNPITVTVTNEAGCTGTSAQFIVSELDEIIEIDSVYICSGEGIVIHGEEVFEEGTYTAVYSTPLGCDSTSQIQLFVYPVPEGIELSQNEISECVGSSIIATVENSSEDVIYTWIFEEEEIAEGSTFEIDNVSMNDNGQYIVIATNEYGCSTYAELLLKIGFCDIEITEVITPNGDGSNDYFYVEHLEAYPNTEVWIYNRWGAEVFYSENYLNDWDGSSQSKLNVGGDELPEGTYYYILKLGGFENQPGYGDIHKGFVYIKR